MQVLTTKCPYCQHEVDSTIERLDGPVVCPSCNKPFAMEMPTAVVTSVEEVDGEAGGELPMATEPEERTLVKVHPAVFRARPLAALTLTVVFVAVIAAFTLSLAGITIGGIAFAETTMLGPASLLTWTCGIALLIVVGIAGWWLLESRFTTLTVTDDRTIYQEGIVARETSEVQHDDVRNIQIDQSFLQRLLGVGTVAVSSSGQDDMEIVAKKMPNPQHIVDVVRKNQD